MKFTIRRLDEYLITDTLAHEVIRVEGYEMPNGSYILLEGDLVRSYGTFRSYRKRLGDLLEDVRLSSHKTYKFISGTTDLIERSKTMAFPVVCRRKGYTNTIFVEAETIKEVEDHITEIITDPDITYTITDPTSPNWNHWTITKNKVEQIAIL